MTAETPADVLIVGAGPTGLSLAITLRQHGIPVRIVDRAMQPSTVSKALTVWSASMEALQGMNVASDLLRDGKRLKALCIGSGKRPLAHLRVGAGIDSPFPFPLLLPQSETERLLGARLADLGVTVERGSELSSLVQDDEGATATITRDDGQSESVRTRYLVGCDGARSAVRHALGIAFEGYTEPQTFLLGDVRIDGGGLDRDQFYLWWSSGGTIALFPFEGDTWRIFAKRDADAPDEPNTTLAELQHQADRHGPPGLRLRDPSWLSVFRINERVAARYRSGRCFLAGDAAHIQSPAGGQGMNTGIQDAVNLGWKLACVLRGIGDADLLLDSYQAERRPIARAVVKAAGQKQHLAFSSGTATRLLKDVAVSVLGNLPVVQRHLQIELSETEVVYRDGPLVALGGPPRNPRRTDVGTRARDANIMIAGQTQPLWPLIGGTRHTLLVFEDAPIDTAKIAAIQDRLAVLRVGSDSDPDAALRKRYRQQGPGWVLIRPDLVIAARGNGGDVALLERYLDQVVRAKR